MEKYKTNHSLYLYFNLDSNKVNDQGCKFLLEAKWNNL